MRHLFRNSLSVCFIVLNVGFSLQSGDCDFDTGWCGWTTDDWSRIKEHGYMSQLYKDHTSEAGYFLSSKTSSSTTAVVVSPLIDPGSYRFSLWYRMLKNFNRLEIYTIPTNSDNSDIRKPVLEETPLSLGTWKYSLTNFTSKTFFQISINAVFFLSGFVHIDDVNLSCGMCKSEDCDFDTGLCGWTADNWSTYKEHEYMSQLYKDHTSEAGYFLSSKTFSPTTTVLVGPSTAPGTYCFSLWYRMLRNFNQLKIYTKSHDRDFTEAVLEETPLLLGTWKYSQANFTFNEYFQIVVDAVFSSPGFVHIDDVILSCGMCQCLNVQSFTMPFKTLSGTMSGAHTTSNAEDDSNQSASPDTYTTEKHEEQLSNKMSVSETGSLVAVVVATSCAFISSFVIGLYLLWRKRKCTGRNQCWKRKPEIERTNTAVKNRAYSDTSSVRFQNRTDVNGSLHNCNDAKDINLGFESRANDSEYNYITWNLEPTEELHTSRQVEKQQPIAANSGYSYLKNFNQRLKVMENAHTNENKFKQKGSVHESGTAIPSAAQKNVEIKTVMKENDDPTYDHASVSMSEKKTKCGGEYTHVNGLVKPIIEQNIYAVPGEVVPKQETQSQKSAKEKYKQHFLLCKPDDQSDKEMPPDTEDHVYFILEKPDIIKI